MTVDVDILGRVLSGLALCAGSMTAGVVLWLAIGMVACRVLGALLAPERRERAETGYGYDPDAPIDDMRPFAPTWDKGRWDDYRQAGLDWSSRGCPMD